MMNDELPPPQIGEIGRAVIRLSDDISELRRELSKMYVGVELYRSERNAQKDDVEEIRRELRGLKDQRTADRRLILSSFVSPLITGGMVAYISFILK